MQVCLKNDFITLSVEIPTTLCALSLSTPPLYFLYWVTKPLRGTLPLTIYHLPFTIYHLSFTIYHLPFDIYHLPEGDFTIDQEEQLDTFRVTDGISGTAGSSHGKEEELFFSTMVPRKHRFDLDLAGRVGAGDVDEAVLDGGGAQGGDLVKGDD